MGFFCIKQKKPRISEALYQERESNPHGIAPTRF